MASLIAHVAAFFRARRILAGEAVTGTGIIGRYQRLEQLRKHAMFCDTCAAADLNREHCPRGRYMVDPWFPKPRPDEAWTPEPLDKGQVQKVKLVRHRLTCPICRFSEHYLTMCEEGRALARVVYPSLNRFAPGAKDPVRDDPWHDLFESRDRDDGKS